MAGFKYLRRVISITAEDSPNVKLGLMQRARGIEPTGQTVLEGVLSWEEYCYRRKMWDAVRQTIGLDARFYVGAELLLFPPDWLDLANKRGGRGERTPIPKSRVWMGIDPAEGGDKSTWSLGDEEGLFKLLTMKTPNTNVVPNETASMIRGYDIDPADVCMDQGNGGQVHADRLADMGFPIRTVAFGANIAPPIRRMRTTKTFEERKDIVEQKYIYVNRRAQMYGEASIMMDPTETGAGLGLDSTEFKGVGIPIGGPFDELRRQLAVIPKTWDRGGEGRLKLMPKNNTEDPNDSRTLVKLIGHSPDEADSFVLMLHARLHKARVAKVGGWY